MLSLNQGLHEAPQLESQWCAAYTIARHEKVVAEQLARRSVECFLPLYHSARCWNRRRANVELPLFPCYLFLRISFSECLRALEAPGLVHIVSFQGKPVAVPDEQIESLRRALELRKSEPFPYLTAGCCSPSLALYSRIHFDLDLRLFSLYGFGNC